jgi:hypothetical protein
MRMTTTALILGLSLATSPASADIIFDAAADFSTTTNTDASAWSYRYSNDLNRDGSYFLLPTFGPAFNTWSPSNPGFWNVSGSFLPYVGVNRTAGDLTYRTGPAFTLPSGAMLIHPGTSLNPGMVVVSWLAQQSGLYDLAFRYSDLDPNGGDGVAWFVDVNGAPRTLASGSYLDGGGSGMRNLSGVSVVAGDRINFVVSTGPSVFFDSTRVDATVRTSAVPEPSGLALAGIGMVAFAVPVWLRGLVRDHCRSGHEMVCKSALDSAMSRSL